MPKKDVGLKIDIAGVLVSENELGKADEYLVSHGLLTDSENKEYRRLEDLAKTRGDWKSFINFSIGIRNRLAKESPKAISEAYRETLGNKFIQDVRDAISYYKEKTGNQVAMHTSMSPAMSEVLRDLIGADTTVRKFAPEKGIAIEDFEGLRSKKEALDMLAKKYGHKEVVLGSYVRFVKHPSEKEVQEARYSGTPFTHRENNYKLENWVDMKSPELPYVIRALADRTQSPQYNNRKREKTTRQTTLMLLLV